jgi:hypothetical protein
MVSTRPGGLSSLFSHLPPTILKPEPLGQWNNNQMKILSTTEEGTTISLSHFTSTNRKFELSKEVQQVKMSECFEEHWKI